MTENTHIPLPVNDRPEREQALKWMAGEQIYAHEKFGLSEDEYRDRAIKSFFDIDEFWRARINMYLDRARLFLSDAQTFRFSSNPENHERAARLEMMAKQAVGKAAMTAKDAVESMIRVFGEMPKPGVNSGVIEPWHPVCVACGEPITEDQTFRYNAGSGKRYHFDHYPESYGKDS